MQCMSGMSITFWWPRSKMRRRKPTQSWVKYAFALLTVLIAVRLGPSAGEVIASVVKKLLA